MSVPWRKTGENHWNIGKTMDARIKKTFKIASRKFLQNNLHGEDVSDYLTAIPYQ
jgi:hypothetical protein